MALAVLVSGCTGVHDRGSRLSAEEIEAIECGMAAVDVKRLLGEPVMVRLEPELMLVALQFSADPGITIQCCG